MVMMRGIVGSLEKHHNVRILDEAVAAAVRLSHRYLAGRQLPDKAVSVLDTACARLSLGQNATPPAIEDAIRQTRRSGSAEAHPGARSRRRRRSQRAPGTDRASREAEVEARLDNAARRAGRRNATWSFRFARSARSSKVRRRRIRPAPRLPRALNRTALRVRGSGFRANARPVPLSLRRTAAQPERIAGATLNAGS